MAPKSEIETQVEAAFDYRGHVTITFNNGDSIEGYIFNREFSNPKLSQDNFIEVFPKGLDERRRFPIASIRSISLSGQDCAETFADGLKRARNA